jgi:hypothetical protein
MDQTVDHVGKGMTRAAGGVALVAYGKRDRREDAGAQRSQVRLIDAVADIRQVWQDIELSAS